MFKNMHFSFPLLVANQGQRCECQHESAAGGMSHMRTPESWIGLVLITPDSYRLLTSMIVVDCGAGNIAMIVRQIA
jgi:hypothetical protein